MLQRRYLERELTALSISSFQLELELELELELLNARSSCPRSCAQSSDLHPSPVRA